MTGNYKSGEKEHLAFKLVNNFRNVLLSYPEFVFVIKIVAGILILFLVVKLLSIF